MSYLIHLIIHFLFISYIYACKWSPKQCGCARNPPSIHNRIVGGLPAIPHSWPWIVSIRKYGSHICGNLEVKMTFFKNLSITYSGGVLISNQHLLTAAHCFKPYHSSHNKDYSFAMGHNAIQEKYIIINPKRIILHTLYNINGKNINDIAIVELNQTIDFNNSRLGFICLPLNHVNDGVSYPQLGKETWVVGWGTTQFEGQVAPILMQVAVPITNNQGCQEKVTAPSKQICAGYDKGGKDSCQGDSGGPLVVDIGQGIFELIGLVSFGVGCAKYMKPGIYTRITGYIDWINQFLKPTNSDLMQTNQIFKPQALFSSIACYQKLSYIIISIEILILTNFIIVRNEYH